MSNAGRHALVVTYEYPPSAGPGVQRIATLVKYLQREGWRITVVTATPVPGQPLDPSMLEEVGGVPVIALPARSISTAIARALAPLKRLRAPGRAARGTASVPAPASAPASSSAPASAPAARRAHVPLSIRIARWISVPDDATAWGRDVVRTARDLHRRDPFDVVLASAPPYSTLVAASRISRATGVPFVADMRDPWRDNHGVRWPTGWHSRRALRLERECLSAASSALAVSAPIATEASEMGARTAEVVPNGFDPERVPVWSPAAEKPLRIAFLGRFGTGITDPAPFFAGLEAARRRSGSVLDARLVVAGPRFDWVDAMVDAYHVADAVEFLGYLPHREALDVVAGCDAGLLVLAEGPASRAVFSSKLFEYLAVGVPVLLVGDTDSEAARLLAEAGSGTIVPPSDPQAVADAIVALAERKRAGERAAAPDAAVVARFDRSQQVRVVSDALAAAIEGRS